MQPHLLLRICFSRWTLKIGCLLLLITGVAILIIDHVMVNASKQLTWSDVNATPACDVDLLLGARSGNRYFTRRIDTVAALYHAGKVRWLLVSGDNGRKNYDGTSGTQQVLIAKDMPTKVTFCDYAGSPTPNSVVCAKKVFDESHTTIVSQEFHNQHITWLAEQHDADAIGSNTPNLDMKHGFYTQLQEKLTRVSAVIDAKALHRQPKCFGPSAMIRPSSEHDCSAEE